MTCGQLRMAILNVTSTGKAGQQMPGCAMLLMVLFTLVIPSKALTADRYWTDTATGYAIGGFDPVSYFTDGTARRGSEKYELVWEGVAWRFASTGNRDVFERDPEIYAPQFGGHDAASMARGRFGIGNPNVFAVREGRLYLFYSAETRASWLADAERLVSDARVQWETARQ